MRGDFAQSQKKKSGYAQFQKPPGKVYDIAFTTTSESFHPPDFYRNGEDLFLISGVGLQLANASARLPFPVMGCPYVRPQRKIQYISRMNYSYGFKGVVNNAKGL